MKNNNQSQTVNTFKYIYKSDCQQVSWESIDWVYDASINNVLQQLSIFVVFVVLFLRIVAVKLGYEIAAATVDLLAQSFGLVDLAITRWQADVVFLWKLIVGDIDLAFSPRQTLKSRLTRRHYCSENSDLFFRHHCNESFVLHSILPRLLRIGNEISHAYDFFLESEIRLRNCSRRFRHLYVFVIFCSHGSLLSCSVLYYIVFDYCWYLFTVFCSHC